MSVIFLFGAETDVQNIYTRLGFDHGEVFLQALDDAVGYLATFPRIGRPYLGKYRRFLVPKHPLAIFYVNESDRVVVHAVFDLRQDPEKLKEKLES